MIITAWLIFGWGGVGEEGRKESSDLEVTEGSCLRRRSRIEKRALFLEVVRSQAFTLEAKNMVKAIFLRKEGRMKTTDSSLGCGPASLAGRRRWGQVGPSSQVGATLICFLKPWRPWVATLFLSLLLFLRLVQWATCRASCLAGSCLTLLKGPRF